MTLTIIRNIDSSYQVNSAYLDDYDSMFFVSTVSIIKAKHVHGSFTLFLLVGKGAVLLYIELALLFDLKSKRSLILSIVEAKRVEDSLAWLQIKEGRNKEVKKKRKKERKRKRKRER